VKKGYVLEVKEEHLLVMTEDQKFVRLQKKHGVDGGEEILFSENQVMDIPKTINRKEHFMKKIKHAKPMGIAAAMVLFLVLSIFAVSGGNGEAQYLLSFDVNPGVGIEVGESDEVLKILAANDEARGLDLKHLEGESLEVFLVEFLDKLEENGYLNEDSDQVLLSYADLLEDEDASQDLVDRITGQMNEYFKGKNMNVNINTLAADAGNFENAAEAGITLGKFQLIQAIEEGEGNVEPAQEGMEADENRAERSLDQEELRGKPVRELLEHPIFATHPRDREEGDHPVFEVHPRDWDKEDGERPHPVYDEHPRDWDKEDGERPHPVFDEHPRNRGNRDQDQENSEDREEEHPIFENHPRDRDKEEGEHPLSDQHPGDQEKSEDQNSESSGDENGNAGDGNENAGDENGNAGDGNENAGEGLGPDGNPASQTEDIPPENPGNENN